MIKEADRGQKITCKCKQFVCHMVNKVILEVIYLTKTYNAFYDFFNFTCLQGKITRKYPPSAPYGQRGN